MPRGRPKGSKDRPRAADAPHRGRPLKNAASNNESDAHETRDPPKNPRKRRKLLADHQSNPWSIAQNAFPAPNGTGSAGNGTASTSATAVVRSGSVDADDEFGAFFNDWAPGELEEITQIEREALASMSSYCGKLGGPFFSLKEGFAHDSEDEDEGMESQNEDDLVQDAGSSTSSGKGDMPIIRKKDGRYLAKPSIFGEGNSRAGLPPTLWIRPPEPIVSLSEHRFDPTVLYRRRIFLWLPHFFVEVLRCPDCGTALEKNGPLVPRRITDLEDNFYIVSWGYYCRDGCKHHFHGWTTKLVKSLPRYLQLAFPAILSRKGGLSRRVLTLLRSANQHKMGPTGVRSVIFEMQTLRFNTLQLQYLESIFELERGTDSQPNVHNFSSDFQYPTFGRFCVSYLTSMMNKAIELEEADADQHTACLSIDDLCVDDNHKVNKHIARVDGVPIFGAMWTCMSGFSIRAQALTLTKGHDERLGPLKGIATSAKLYGYNGPAVIYSDDPVKDKSMVLAAFPALGENLTPMAAAHGLKSLSLPPSLNVNLLGTVNLVESALSSLISPLDIDPAAHLCVSLDAEWNITRHVGVSTLQIAPHSEPDVIYVIPVHRFRKLPAAFLRLLISPQVFLIGSAIKGDLTRLKKQFPQLLDCASNMIDLKQFAIRRGVIKKNTSGALDTLTEKVLGAYLPKDATFRKTDEWETDLTQRPELLNYAALDVLASRLIFEKINKIAPLDLVQRNTPAGTRIALLVHEGGEIAAYGRIASSQPANFAGIRNGPSRILIDIDLVLLPSAAAILHLDSSSTAKSGALTLSQLQLISDSPVFQILSPLGLLQFDRRAEVAHGTVNKGKERAQFPEDEFDSSPLGKGLLEILHKLAESPGDIDVQYTRIKKDIFHAFHMIPIPAHGLRAIFFRTLRDHIMRWDPELRQIVDEVCRQEFNVSFEVMLIRDPKFIKEHVPRYVPPPSVLVPAIQHVYNAFGNALDAETGRPLFDKKAWEKANAVLELAREGYLSDIPGVVVYERAGVDEYGLWKWICKRGSNKLEGGPHSDIYRKFGALNAGPRLTVNSLTDHRTRYNLQAFAKHQFGVNWDYHFNLGMLNRTSFLLNYLSDVLAGASSYSNWINTDLYERTSEKFGICTVPEVLRTRLNMASYSDEAASKFELNSSEDWLRQRQGVGLPILPPTTLDARNLQLLQAVPVKNGLISTHLPDNGTDPQMEKPRQYVTGDVLSTYSKTWEKISNIRASQDLIAAKIDLPQYGVIALTMTKKCLIPFRSGSPIPNPESPENLRYSLRILISQRQAQPLRVNHRPIMTTTGHPLISEVTILVDFSLRIQIQTQLLTPCTRQPRHKWSPHPFHQQRGVESYLKASAKIKCAPAGGVSKLSGPMQRAVQAVPTSHWLQRG
ncbi:hypothetical protein B0H13DRAFT_1918616 [Mycena leptocephala]|nr:hypothetical protein B0H13DRAFT_1918616 [Mycena leptocephala]